MVRVAVIGAGAAGLCALRHMRAKPSVFQPVAFELGERVGGTWVYTDRTGIDKNGQPIHSSMYRNLKTNLPKEVMAFPDFPFDSTLPSFISHLEVMKYLQKYTEHFNLEPYIKSKTLVERLTPIQENGTNDVTWELTYRDVNNSQEKTTQKFDGVVVCSGHYSVPLMPKLPGMNSFEGEQVHSHDYRDPSRYANKTVVCLGAGASGVDIAIDISSKAKQVVLSHNKPFLTSPIPANVSQKPGIRSLEKDSVNFRDGSSVKADIVLYCTGYRFVYPFLTEDCNLNIDEDERVTPLFKHLIHTQFPSLSFIGLCKIICPFPSFHIQTQFALSVLDGSLKLPSREEMDADTEEDFKARMCEGLARRHAHFMGPRQWDYSDQLAKMANVSPVWKSIQELYDMIHETRIKNLLDYKKINYELTGSDSFKVIN
ncbi:hypothetical protein LOTGIDRAFT_223998 [Lottia gigantea]|uniref:Flavin-containing monooxygenase n=1 Tax=Lottia gigantea TaxID=225164 RepID=V4B9T8_LOTGI|nr:hypothetical protein LOTGIDRAFT_223998 [Lottia gigantea]ESP04261.1 hypothetical protein LOTGIDRAFT_223998 [Lottia gigantea]